MLPKMKSSENTSSQEENLGNDLWEKCDGDVAALREVARGKKRFSTLAEPSLKRLREKDKTQRVHVGIWYILRAQRGSHIPTLRPKYVLYSYMDVLGKGTGPQGPEPCQAQILSSKALEAKSLGVCF